MNFDQWTREKVSKFQTGILEKRGGRTVEKESKRDRVISRMLERARSSLSQERLHGGGTQGRASVTGSPDRGGMQSLIGVIDPSTASLVLFCPAKKALYNSYS